MNRERLLPPEEAVPEGFTIVNTKIAKFGKVSEEQYQKSLKENGIAYDIRHVFNIKDLPFPVRATQGSAGYDFSSPIDFILHPGEVITVPSGICCDMYPGWVLNLMPRSSITINNSISLVNTVTVIDSDYYMADNEGQIMLIFKNNSHDKRWVVHKGDRVVQGIFLLHGLTIDDLALMSIRNGGLGSTGK